MEPDQSQRWWCLRSDKWDKEPAPGQLGEENSRRSDAPALAPTSALHPVPSQQSQRCWEHQRKGERRVGGEKGKISGCCGDWARLLTLLILSPSPELGSFSQGPAAPQLLCSHCLGQSPRLRPGTPFCSSHLPLGPRFAEASYLCSWRSSSCHPAGEQEGLDSDPQCAGEDGVPARGEGRLHGSPPVRQTPQLEEDLEVPSPGSWLPSSLAEKAPVCTGIRDPKSPPSFTSTPKVQLALSLNIFMEV